MPMEQRGTICLLAASLKPPSESTAVTYTEVAELYHLTKARYKKVRTGFSGCTSDILNCQTEAWRPGAPGLAVFETWGFRLSQLHTSVRNSRAATTAVV